jgi:predicted GNAT family acetyltransferase
MYKIEHASHVNKGTFFIRINNQKVAEMNYVVGNDKKLIIEHTDVDDSLKGQGIGKKLLAELVEYARKEHLSVLPLCPFANAVLKKTPAWQDVLR